MKKHSWVCTLVTQIFLCSVLFIAINIGQPQKHMADRTAQSRPLDVLFMSVVGGYRPLEEQILLLKQMAKVAKVYQAQLVINISELGEEDPLTQNATWHFQSLNVPWYTTKSLKGRGVDHFLKQIKIPYGKTLDIIAVNTELFQEAYFLHVPSKAVRTKGILLSLTSGPPTGAGEHQLLWLTKTLEESISEWRIILGFHPLVACNGSVEGKENLEDLRHMLLRYGVNAYLSGLACAEYVHKGGAALLSNATQMDKGPYLTSVNKMFLQHNEQTNGFLLHRVGPLEFVTYFVTLKGEVVLRTKLRQGGKEVM